MVKKPWSTNEVKRILHIFYNIKSFDIELQNFIEGEILQVNTAPNWFMKESAKILGEIHNGLSDLHSLDKGSSKGFFMLVNPKSALESYKKSLKITKERNEVVAVDDLTYRIKLLNKLKNIDLDMEKFTYKNTHGDYFISQIICKGNRINGVIDFTSACIHPAWCK